MSLVRQSISVNARNKMLGRARSFWRSLSAHDRENIADEAVWDGDWWGLVADECSDLRIPRWAISRIIDEELCSGKV